MADLKATLSNRRPFLKTAYVQLNDHIEIILLSFCINFENCKAHYKTHEYVHSIFVTFFLDILILRSWMYLYSWKYFKDLRLFFSYLLCRYFYKKT